MPETMRPVLLRLAPDVWERVQQAAREQSAEQGETISAAEWVRRAIEAMLDGGWAAPDEQRRSRTAPVVTGMTPNG